MMSAMHSPECLFPLTDPVLRTNSFGTTPGKPANKQPDIPTCEPPSHFCLLDALCGLTTGLHPRAAFLHVTAATVRGTWLSPTHNSILWCNQLLKPLSRFLTEAAQKLHFEAPAPLHGPEPHAAASRADSGFESNHFPSAQEDAGSHADYHASEAVGSSASTDSFTPDYTSLVLDAARTHLLPPVLPAGFLPPATHAPSNIPPACHNTPSPSDRLCNASAFTDVESLQQGCSGPNLAWYLQYLTPTPLEAPRSTSTTAGGGSSSSSSGGGGSNEGPQAATLSTQQDILGALRMRGQKAAEQVRA
jgi:hypothetical protein